MSADAHVPAHTGDDTHEEHAHRSWMFYTGIAVFLAIVTAIELGPLFDLFNIPSLVLLAMSAVKFFVVVAFFMHLWDDPPIFTRVFGIPLIGGSMMVLVLMSMASSIYPSSRVDSFPIQERYWSAFNGDCYSWLTSSITNRPYCASGCTDASLAAGNCKPNIDRARVVKHLGPVSSGPTFTIEGLSEADVKATLIQNGKELYEVQCATCHGMEGQGQGGVYPPLAGSDYPGFIDPREHAAIIVRGLSGPITVNAQNYSGSMAAFGQLSDLEIAAIATYERNAWGNNHGVVLPAMVKEVR